MALSASPLPLIVLFIVLATWLTLRGHRPARAFLLIFGIFYAAVLISFLRSMTVLRTVPACMASSVFRCIYPCIYPPGHIEIPDRISRESLRFAHL